MSLTSKRSLAGLLAGAALGSNGARISRKSNYDSATHKEIAGVPVLNYDLAYGGQSQHGDKPEQWVVVAKPGTTDDRLKELCERAKHCDIVGHPSSGGVPFFEISATMDELHTVLASAPGEFEFVEPDGKFALDPDEDVEMTSTSWGLGRVGAPSRHATGAGTHIYVLDTGVRDSHNDFGGRAVAGIDVSSGRVRECASAILSCAVDRSGHGTHCAGTAAGTTFGVAVQARVHSAKVLGNDGSGSWSWTYAALDWIAANQQTPAIASMSLGGSGRLTAMQVAVDGAVNAGVTVVVASGNQNSDGCNYSPSFIPSALTVGSTDSADAKSSFSNFGTCVEIWAPGTGILSAGIRGDDSTDTKSGTSMACPHVSGAAALALSENPGMTPAQVRSFILDRAERGAITDQNFDDVNIFLFVGSGTAPVPAPTPPPPARLECPDFAGSREPDSAGDCICGDQKICSLDRVNANCPTSGGDGAFQGRWFLSTCTDCRCYSSLPA